jgi:hypothetical protein
LEERSQLPCSAMMMARSYSRGHERPCSHLRGGGCSGVWIGRGWYVIVLRVALCSYFCQPNAPALLLGHPPSQPSSSPPPPVEPQPQRRHVRPQRLDRPPEAPLKGAVEHRAFLVKLGVGPGGARAGGAEVGVAGADHVAGGEAEKDARGLGPKVVGFRLVGGWGMGLVRG